MLAIQGSTVIAWDIHGSTSVKLHQLGALFIQFIENQVSLHISSITCSSSGGATQTAPGILRAYNISCLCHDCRESAIVHGQQNIKTILNVAKNLAAKSE
jgi:hypothetical protein